MCISRSPLKTLCLTALSLAALLLGACKPTPPAQPAAPAASSTADVVAQLDGQPLRRALLDEIARQQAGVSNPYDLPTTAAPAASAQPADRQRLLDELVDVELLARKAQERGLDKDTSLQAESELQAKSILAQVAVRDQIASLQVSEAELATAYDERVPPDQFKLAHIQLADAALAPGILEQLRQGRPFAELAKRHSVDMASRSQGGNLGWLMYDQMPPEVAAAVRHLKPGERTSQAIKTSAGWHIVEVQGLRPLAERPSLQAAKVWLHPQIVQAKVEAQQQQWRREAKVQLASTP